MPIRQRVLDVLSNRDLAAKTATFAAAASVGATFAPNLLPRKPIDQAIATGVSASIWYGVASMTQTFVDSFSRRVAPGRERSRQESRKYLNTIANLMAVGAGLAIQRALPPKADEPVKRAFVRTAGWEFSAIGAIGVGVTAVAGAAEAIDRRQGGRLHPAAIPVGFVFGSALSTAEIVWYRRHQQQTAPLVESIGQGAGVMVGVSALTFAETRAARGIARVIRRGLPGMAIVAEPIGHAVVLAALAGASMAGIEYANRRAEHGGAAVEAAYSEAPQLTRVSGGPESVVDWTTLSREGRRFVNMGLTAAEIEDVTGQAAQDPIRAFVGLESAPTVDSRVSLMLDEMERLGAFERSVICLSSPTGTGYINYVMAEALEYMTRGDCAIVALQYSLRPSFLSLDRVKVGREQNRALLHAVHGRLMGIPPEKRPRLVAFGESLGAHTLQDAFIHEGTTGLKRSGISHALFVGTPAESKWMEQWRLYPERYDPDQEVVEVHGFDEWSSLSRLQRQSARYFLLSHDEDPICKFSPALAVQEPAWMREGPQRSPALPEGVRWRPFITFVLTAVDVKNATNVVPGQFEALGHDYRADLARFTSIAFDLPVGDDELERIEQALRQREMVWAERRVVAEQFAQAWEGVARQVHTWGVATDAESLVAMSSQMAGLPISGQPAPTVREEMRKPRGD